LPHRYRISELEAQLAAVRTDYSKSILELERAMHTRFSKYEEVNKSLRIKLEKAFVRCVTLTSGIEGIERELEGRDKRHKDELTQISSGLHDKYEHELNRLRAAFSEMEQISTSAQHAKNILEVKLAGLQERAISLENTVSGLESSIVLKDRVINDLSEQLRELRTSSASCDRIKELETEVCKAKRDSDHLRYECERISRTLEEKENMLSYVSGEIEGIKRSFEEKLVFQHDQLVSQYQEKIDYMKCQLAEAADTLIRMEKEHAHQRKENAHLQSRIECMQHESDNTKSKQSEKLSQLQSLIETFRDAYFRCMHVLLYRLIRCSSDTFSEWSWGPCGCIVSVSGSPVALCKG
jgi:chromosome segregation ATPase